MVRLDSGTLRLIKQIKEQAERDGVEVVKVFADPGCQGFRVMPGEKIHKAAIINRSFLFVQLADSIIS
jgi:hypothetical protein